MINPGDPTIMKLKIRNPFLAILLMVPLLLIFGAILLYKTGSDTNKRVEADNQSKTDRIVELLSMFESQIDEEAQSFFNSCEARTKLMAYLLESHITENQYSGPDFFEKGYVVRFNNGDISCITRSDFIPDFSPDWFNLDGEGKFYTDEENSKSFYVSSARILDDFYYIELSPIDEIFQKLFAMNNTELIFETLEKAFGSRIIGVEIPDTSAEQSNPNEPVFTFISKDFDGVTKPEELGITPEVLSAKPEILNLNGIEYRCTYKDIRQFDTNQTVIILSDIQKALAPDVIITILSVFLSAVFMLAFIMSLYWFQAYVRDHALIHSQVRNYHPQRLRKLAFSTILIGTFGLFVFVLFYQYVAKMRNETVSNRSAIETIMNILGNDYEEESIYRENGIKWYTDCANGIASVFSVSDDSFVRSKLTELNDMIGSQYIMQFDAAGNEIASSNGLIGYSLKETDILNLFQPLLSGYKEITPAPMDDPFSNQKFQFIGVNIPYKNSFGALIIAVDPAKAWEERESQQFNAFLQHLTTPEKLCVILNKQDDIVRYSSEPTLIGRVIPTVKFSDNTLEESDLDTYDINKKRYYGPFLSDDIYTGLYLTEENHLHNDTVSVASISALGFFTTAGLIGLFMLSFYTPENYENYLETQLKKKGKHIDMDSLEDFLDKSGGRSPKTLVSRWTNLIPEEKTSLFIHLILIFTFIFLIRFNRSINSMVEVTVFDFILFGKWHRGFNMLGFAGAILIVACLIGFMLIRSLILKIFDAVLDPKVNTVLALILSLLQYAAVIGCIYIIMGFFGFEPAIQLTSIGILSMAISLGSKDLVADILAGLFIIFEDDFHVGDFIEVNGFRGIVQNIGIRTTRIIGLGDYIKIIDNQSIKNVLNLSKLNTWYTLELKVPLDTPIKDIEAMMEKDLPQVADAVPEIISGPFYKGIWNISGGLTISISCECDEENLRSLQRKLNREILLMFNKNGIKLL